MRKMLVTLFVMSSLLVFSQSLDSKNFNSSTLNSLLLKEINSFRKERGLDTLIFSKTMYDSLSYPNCKEVANKCDFYHPDVTTKWKRGTIKKMIAKESNKLLNDTIVTYDNGIPWITYYENAFRATLSNYTSYSELVAVAIDSWEKSPEHQKTQNTVFESKGLPSFFSCHSEYAKNGYVYIYINFTLVQRER